MNSQPDRARTHLAAWISLLMLVMSVAMPVLERADFVGETVVESPHDPGECPSGHDHTVCTQVNANLSASTEGHGREIETTVVRVTLPTHTPDGRSSVFEVGHPSRAPPLS